MWSRRFVLGALLVSACQPAPTDGAIDSMAGPRRGSTVDSTVSSGGGGGDVGAGGGDAGLADAGSAGAVDAGRGSGDAGADAPRPATVCSAGNKDLSSVGPGDFRISFHVVTTQTGWAALMNQRSSCDYGVFWDVRQSGSGTLWFEIDSGGGDSYESLESTVAINDGKPHDVLVARVGGTLTIQIDGVAAGQRASSSSLGVLPSLRVNDDTCVGAASDTTAPFAGSVLSQICVSRN